MHDADSIFRSPKSDDFSRVRQVDGHFCKWGVWVGAWLLLLEF